MGFGEKIEICSGISLYFNGEKPKTQVTSLLLARKNTWLPLSMSFAKFAHGVNLVKP